MHTLGGMQGRPAPKLVDTIDAEGLLKKLIAEGRQSECAPAATDAGPISRLGRCHARRGHDAVPACGQGGRRAVHAGAARRRRRCDADEEGSHQCRDARGGRSGQRRLPRRQSDAALAATLEALQMCIDRGVDINAFNTAGQTAMHVAAGRGLDGVVKFLAEQGAKLDRTDKQGRTPLDVALGVGAGVARGNNRNQGGPRESTAALLRQLMSESGRTTTSLQ